MSFSRDLQFDGLKFVLMFLVILGHLTFYDYGIGVKRMIYSFHMPVFVFLSGYFTSLSQNKEKRFKWIKKTLILYIVAQVSVILLRMLLSLTGYVFKGYEFHLSSYLNWHNLICPEFALWYLVCLLYWRITIWTIGNRIKEFPLFFVSIIAAILMGYIPLGYEFSFQRAFAFFPFFMLGIVFKKRALIEKMKRIPILYAVTGLIIGLIAARQMPSYLPVNHYGSWKDLSLRTTQMFLGLGLCLIIVRVSRNRFTELFAKYGSKTLWIYIGHIYLIILGETVFHHFRWTFDVFVAIIIDVLYCLFLIILANKYEALIKNKSREPSKINFSRNY